MGKQTLADWQSGEYAWSVSIGKMPFARRAKAEKDRASTSKKRLIQFMELRFLFPKIIMLCQGKALPVYLWVQLGSVPTFEQEVEFAVI